MDRDARKQILLTRIAFERVELRHELARLREAARVPNLLRRLVGLGLRPAPFGTGGTSASSWISMGLTWLRRYRLAAAVLGAAAPLLRGRRRWLRIAKLGAVAAAGWFSWRAVKSHDAKR